MRRRLAALAFVTAMLTFIGSGAMAMWSSQVNVGSTATGARVGATQAFAATNPLVGTFSTGALTLVGPVTVTNTGSRSAAYSAGFLASSATAAVPGAVAITVGTVTTAAGCTATASPGDPVTGTLSATVEFGYGGTLAAGASVVLCVRTSITASTLSAYASSTIVATLSTTVTSGTWSATTEDLSFVQTFAAAEVPGLTAGYYWIATTFSPQRCVQQQYGPGNAAVWQSGCTTEANWQNGRNQLWQFVPTGDGYYRIVVTTDTTLGLTAATPGSGQPVTLTATATASAQWSVSTDATGAKRFVLRADPTLCLAPSGGSAADQVMMTVTTCDGSAAQGLLARPLGVVSPAPVPLICSDGGASAGWNALYSWNQLTYYQNQVTYRVLFDGAVLPSMRYARATGYDTTLQLEWATVTSALVGIGSHTVEVQQSVFGGAFTSTGTGVLTVAATAPYLQCG